MKKFKEILSSIYLAILNVFIAIIFVLNYKVIYKVAIDIFSIDKATNLSKDQLYLEYSKIIHFINDIKAQNLLFDKFTISDNAVFHFIEVRNIFIAIYVFTVISIMLTICFMIYNAFKNRSSLKAIVIKALIINISLTLLLAILSTLDFNTVFEYFHKAIFSNDYWLFDTVKDSIILALPEEFFLMCTALILITSIILAFLELLIANLFTLNKIKISK